jgi:hypothetical protein
MDDRSETHPWLLLIHQIPPKPNYFRVKIGRRLQQVGAVAVKQSVYALPVGERTREDMSWIVREIVEGGGDATLCEAALLDGLTDEQLRGMFQAARRADYEKITQAAHALQDEVSGAPAPDAIARIRSQLPRLRNHLAEVVAIDFFPVPERSVAEILLADLNSRLDGAGTDSAGPEAAGDLKGRIWVTRQNVFVDRIAGAWLVKRFVDEAAAFKFVPSSRYAPQPDEIRYDMSDAEYTHEGDRCTFEVMLDRFGMKAPALISIAEVVHDIDLKDDKFGRPEAPGLRALLSGVVAACPGDQERLQRGAVLFDALYEFFKRDRKASRTRETGQ